jgi:hypothetical protein
LIIQLKLIQFYQQLEQVTHVNSNDLSAKQNVVDASTNILGIGTSVSALNCNNITLNKLTNFQSDWNSTIINKPTNF